MKSTAKIKKEKRIRRHQRVRSEIFGTGNVPRLAVFRSNSHIYAQMIDDESKKTIVSASDIDLKDSIKKSEKAEKVGELIAKRALEKKIQKAVFDRGGFRYQGRVQALAEGARKAGLKL